MGLDTKTYWLTDWLTDRQSQCDFYLKKKSDTEVRSKIFILCVVTVTFRVLSLFVVMKCYSYSKIVLQLILVPPGEYQINRLTNPNPRLKSRDDMTRMEKTRNADKNFNPKTWRREKATLKT
jgi:hypothetical protein